jgi:hypothetical protein
MRKLCCLFNIMRVISRFSIRLAENKTTERKTTIYFIKDLDFRDLIYIKNRLVN